MGPFYSPLFQTVGSGSLFLEFLVLPLFSATSPFVVKACHIWNYTALYIKYYYTFICDCSVLLYVLVIIFAIANSYDTFDLDSC